MKKYKKPALVSYKSQDIMEIVGPAHANSAGVINTNRSRPFEKTGRLLKKSGR